jgi:flagellin
MRAGITEDTMSRINTNISSLQAITTLTKNQNDLSTRLSRLSSGLKINSGKDNPAGLIASEGLRSEITGINQAIDNSQRAGNVLNTAEGALNEVSSLLLEVQGLTNQAANTGALSPDEVDANQLQVDAILNSVDRISNTTQFNGVKLLNGGLDYTTTGLNGNAAITHAQLNQAKVPNNGSIGVVVNVTQSAKTGEVRYNAAAVSAANNVTLEISGNNGTEQLSFAGGTSVGSIATAINNISATTGVTATASATALRFDSTDFGSKQYVAVKVISDLTGGFTFNLTGGQTKAFGQDAKVTINGSQAEVNGLNASVRTSDLDVSLDLGNSINTVGGTTNFTITGGGANFQLGSQVNSQSQVNVGIGSVASTTLGDATTGYLASLKSGGTNSLTSGNIDNAQLIISKAISQVATLRGRIGAFQKDILDTNVNSLSVALENVTSSESSIRDADFATETAALTRAQILVQANTSVLSQANSAPQSVLKLLGG